MRTEPKWNGAATLSRKDFRGRGLEHWIHIVDPNSLQTLSISPGPFPNASEAFLRTFRLTPPESFPYLNALSISLSHTVILRLPVLLQYCPSLDRLCLSIGSFKGEETALMNAAAQSVSHIVTRPSIRFYDGPYELLHLVSLENVLDLNLGSFKRKGCDPDDAAETMTASCNKQSMHNLRCFKANLSRLNSSLVSIIRALSPNLKILHLTTFTGDIDGSIGSEMLSIEDFPKNIEEILLSCLFNTHDAKTECDAFVNNLLDQYTSLRSICLADTKHCAYYYYKKDIAIEKNGKFVKG
ncbi:hypothetical protein H0H92_010392 [Tricholoma furcatifolium]|nr:hypothetical protein H0H92_010392 [Tricholoma furcatifolium]